MGLGETFGSVMDFAKNNPLLAGILTVGVFFFLSKVFGGNDRGLFGNFGTAAQAGGAGLAVSLASAMMSEEGIGQLIPDFAKDWFGMEDDPEPEPDIA